MTSIQALWADPAATYDKVASAYAAAFLHELDHKPFDREILTRFATATRRGSQRATPSATSVAVRATSAPSWPRHGVDAVGIDLSAGMVAQARLSYPAMTFTQGNMTSLAVPDDTRSRASSASTR